MKFNRTSGDATHQNNIRPVFQYQQKKINKMVEELNLKPVNLSGLYNDLQSLKKALDNVIGTTEYFHLAYGLGDIGWHWDMSNPKNKKDVENMWKIVNGIEDNIKLAYAYLLAGLGERLKDDKE